MQDKLYSQNGLTIKNYINKLEKAIYEKNTIEFKNLLDKFITIIPMVLIFQNDNNAPNTYQLNRLEHQEFKDKLCSVLSISGDLDLLRKFYRHFDKKLYDPLVGKEHKSYISSMYNYIFHHYETPIFSKKKDYEGLLYSYLHYIDVEVLYPEINKFKTLSKLSLENIKNDKSLLQQIQSDIDFRINQAPSFITTLGKNNEVETLGALKPLINIKNEQDKWLNYLFKNNLFKKYLEENLIEACHIFKSHSAEEIKKFHAISRTIWQQGIDKARQGEVSFLLGVLSTAKTDIPKKLCTFLISYLENSLISQDNNNMTSQRSRFLLSSYKKLLNAVEKDDLKEIEELIRDNCNPNKLYYDEYGYLREISEPFTLTYNKGDFQTAKLLFEKKARLDPYEVKDLNILLAINAKKLQKLLKNPDKFIGKEILSDASIDDLKELARRYLPNQNLGENIAFNYQDKNFVETLSQAITKVEFKNHLGIDIDSTKDLYELSATLQKCWDIGTNDLSENDYKLLSNIKKKFFIYCKDEMKALIKEKLQEFESKKFTSAISQREQSSQSTFQQSL